jgi:hypothetical protein
MTNLNLPQGVRDEWLGFRKEFYQRWSIARGREVWSTCTSVREEQGQGKRQKGELPNPTTCRKRKINCIM